MFICEIEQETNIRFKLFDDLQAYINAIDVDHDSEDNIFRGWLYKLNMPEFNRVNRSQYCTSTNFKQDSVEYIGNTCYIPTSGDYF